MAEKKCLSIIIPAYNVGQFLGRCIDSLSKTPGIDKCEIIIIDDGSTVVVSELFGRVIDMTGDSSADIIMWDSDLIDGDDEHYDRGDNEYFAHNGMDKCERSYTGKQVIGIQLEKSRDFVATVWLGAYRRAFLLDNDLMFEEGIIHEDELWVPKVLIAAESVYYIPEKLYLYRIRKGSVTNPDNEDRTEHVRSMMYVYPELFRFYDDALADDPLMKPVEANLAQRYLYYIFRYRFWKYDCGKGVDLKKLWKTSGRIKDKIKVMILFFIAR